MCGLSLPGGLHKCVACLYKMVRICAVRLYKMVWIHVWFVPAEWFRYVWFLSTICFGHICDLSLQHGLIMFGYAYLSLQNGLVKCVVCLANMFWINVWFASPTCFG